MDAVHDHSPGSRWPVNQEYDEELWYSNVRVTKATFTFLLNVIRSGVSANRGRGTEGGGIGGKVPRRKCALFTLGIFSSETSSSFLLHQKFFNFDSSRTIF